MLVACPKPAPSVMPALISKCLPFLFRYLPVPTIRDLNAFSIFFQLFSSLFLSFTSTTAFVTQLHLVIIIWSVFSRPKHLKGVILDSFAISDRLSATLPDQLDTFCISLPALRYPRSQPATITIITTFCLHFINTVLRLSSNHLVRIKTRI